MVFGTIVILSARSQEVTRFLHWMRVRTIIWSKPFGVGELLAGYVWHCVM